MNGIVLIGAPGSGKSSIGKILAHRTGMIYVSSGDIARNMAKHDPEAADALGRGLMAPEDRMRDEIYKILYGINLRGDMFILDGFPRFVGQMEWLRERFPSTTIIHVDPPIYTCIQRLRDRGRCDDINVLIEARMNFYISQTLQILESYEHHVVTNEGSDGVRMAVDRIIDTIPGIPEVQHKC